ncbi:pseudouridine-5'-phosphate glycosidase [Mycoplasmopsis agalactiae]|uniref:Pseudouridine-5'-phosphate glycosidase n=2 Tax=Bacteria TaxID=2 RepID=PSUG_MYCAP|nr:pseudouridine-5'-phosphate glycosidase [Mycoplasmopsis agalactiae]A5IXG3.1 RecName: Full=Pseudouridine-5'-phosphate glycosidase; Short=PsiMP glycosidase [Mycoplasmopsis agalactiae PG2]MCE6056831.1 pseudouridine-5'-phosphate glycosidase [Mycoplasmopsis agalactiae]MCE6095004.1 pseudouridine-5'-phosphate glycosidase [Mycoplasmopsis agalactiae]NLS34758.1 pseudouridine-5'-phosphate glycosidase [Mycoplasmopsis agalactiae]QYR08306.1 pseudouridine-5'-phosphate glycosidase [Mycoplasmopsis agalactiae
MNIVFSKEVESALKHKRPVVALESTIITHGMPYPKNVEMALNVENIIRKQGAVPATIAIINGIIHVGLENDEINELAKLKDVIKTSKRDFGYVLANKKNGGTTVSGTVLVAQKVGIPVFATGGIGGVHRGAEITFDISRDLDELSTNNVLVVCAGAKLILDLGLTLEYLETKGVEVLGYNSDKLPAFYSSSSEFNVTYNVHSASEVAAIMKAKWKFTNGGIILANPIPEQYGLEYEYILDNINKAIEQAKVEGISGKKTTPYLLSKVLELTEGKSLEANIQLVYNNAKVAAQVAVEYAKQK